MAHDDDVSTEHLRLLARANIIGILVATEEGIVEANDAFIAMIGYTRSELAGRIPWRTLALPEHTERDGLALEEMRLRGACTPYETEYWRKDGSRVPVELGAALLDREPLRWIAFVLDLTAQKRIEHELRQAAAASEMSNRAKDDFVNMLVHELRQPLATMSIAALLVKGALEHEPIVERIGRPLQVLENQIASMTRLTDELLLASKIVRGAMPHRRTAVDLAAIVREVAGDQRMRAEAAGLSLTLDAPNRPVTVTGDAMRLRHIVGNMIDNAIKYTRPGGRIEVALRDAGAECALRVKDSGIGIAPEQIPHVFEPFRRATHEGSGFGIGLAVVKSVVEQHGGRVGIASDGRNQGTEIVVTLPISR